MGLQAVLVACLFEYIGLPQKPNLAIQQSNKSKSINVMKEFPTYVKGLQSFLTVVQNYGVTIHFAEQLTHLCSSPQNKDFNKGLFGRFYSFCTPFTTL